MKNVFGFLSIVVLTGWSLFSISSCSDQYDDSEIKDRLDKVEDRVTKLEEWCSTVNSEIISLKGLITALENKDYVTGVETLEDGYRITFYKSGNIIIRNGKDGIDGYTPIIGVAKYSDGFYYWTVQTQDGNTDWLTDADGDMVRATGNNGKDGVDGEDGADGEDGVDGNNGLNPYIGDNGNWWVGTTDTGVKAQGEQGISGLSPYIGDNGNWWIGTTDTGVKAQGEQGISGLSPYIGDNGNWWIGTTDTGVKAQGEQGVSGLSPYIGDNGNWWIGTTDTGVKAQGDKGLDAVAPQVRINDNTNEWEISIDGGKTYTSTGVKATGNQGDSMFKDIDNSNADYVVLTLADGKTKITLPKQSDISFSIGDVSENNEVMEINQKTTIAVNFSSGLKEGFFSAIIADVITPGGIVTRAGSSGWEIEIIKPTFTNGTYNNDAAIIITPISAAVVGSCAIVRVTVIDNRGREITSSRPVRCGRMDLVLKETVAEGGLQAAVEKRLSGVTPEIIRTLVVDGTLNKDDYDYIVGQLKGLQELTLNSAVSIPDKALNHRWDEPDTSLTKISAPKVVAIGELAFNNCAALEEIDMPALKTIGKSAFYSCISLKKFASSSVTTVEESAFIECSSLESVSLPGITEIKRYTFCDCSALVDIVFPEVKAIGECGFKNCTSLVSLSDVLFPKLETFTGVNVFEGCTGLTVVSLSKVTSLETGLFSLCQSLREASLPKVTTIGGYVFRNCTLLETVDLPEAVSVENMAFAECASLATIVLPKAETCDTHVFWKCTSLENVILPAVKKLGSRVFSECSGLLCVELCTAVDHPGLDSVGACLFESVDTSHIELSLGYGEIVVTKTLVGDNQEWKRHSGDFQYNRFKKIIEKM